MSEDTKTGRPGMPIADAQAAVRALREAGERLENACCNAAQILQKTYEEWAAEGQWSDWDAATVAELSAARIASIAVLAQTASYGEGE